MTNGIELAALLKAHRRIHVVGLSPRPERTSHRVALSLVARGFEVIPVNPMVREVMGKTSFPSLEAASEHGSVELVNVFRDGEALPGIVDDIERTGGVEIVWLQLGVHHGGAEQRLKDMGMILVADRCIKVEAERLNVRHA